MSVSRARSIPIFTPLARAVKRDVNLVFYIIVILLTALVLAVKTWGLVALTMAALPLVPVMFAIFVWISFPKGV
jgi:ABC-type polysaccharide/polyol phosphate export permease